MNVRIALGWIAALLVLSPPRSHALEIPAEMRQRLLGEMEGKTKEPLMEGEAPDNSIDPDTYIVGGGDGFRISIVGLPSKEYFPVVDPNGNLYDSDLGFIALGRIPLSKALKIIQDRVRASLKRNYDVYVALKKAKRVNVTVTGLVNVAGSYQLPGTHRVLDAIRAANNGNLPVISKSDYRRVTVRNRDSVKTYDLVRFFSKQDLSQNPYLYPGDNVNLDPIDAKVYVSGEVLEPVVGWVAVVPGESLADLLSILNLKQSSDSNAILVQKADSPSHRSLKRVSIKEASGFILHPNDLITVGSREDFPRPDTVQVTGEVKRPGTYPVLSAQSSLRDIIALAGGSTEQADVERTVIIRHRRSEKLLPQNEESDRLMSYGAKGSLAGGLRSVRPEMTASINDLQTLADYTLVRSGELDSQAALQDGDEIFVPRQDPFVYVSGNVVSPGAYPYVKGQEMDDYVKKAGGYTDKADTKNQFMLASYHGLSQIRDSGKPLQGDIIVVPASIEYKQFLNVVLPIIQLVPAVLSILVTLVVLGKK
ncbi:MAG: SLBB domain-containing protein [Fibrobacteres bacterium]|nr:SLBB domain-containing protein [Fibrobacterota bacterium]